jgi:hypothetical protein
MIICDVPSYAYNLPPSQHRKLNSFVIPVASQATENLKHATVKSSHVWREEREKPAGLLEFVAFDARSAAAGCQPAENKQT